MKNLKKYTVHVQKMRNKIIGFSRKISNTPFIKKNIVEKVKKSKFIKEFDWKKYSYYLFSPEFRPVIHKAFIYTICIVATYYIGKIISLSFQTPPTLTNAKIKNSSRPSKNAGGRKQLQNTALKIKQLNIFRTDNPGQAKTQVSSTLKNLNKPCLKANGKSSLPITLKGTLVLQDSVKSLASVQVRGGKLKIRNLREGDKIDRIAKIGRIINQEIYIKNLKTGKCEYVKAKTSKVRNSKINILSKKESKKLLDKAGDNAIRNEGNKFFIKQSFKEELLRPENLTSLLSQARAIQIRNPDGSLSFKLTDVVPGSLYSKMNIQDDDIITSIGGKKIYSINEVMNLFSKAKGLDNLSISVIRDGNEENLEYNFIK